MILLANLDMQQISQCICARVYTLVCAKGDYMLHCMRALTKIDC